MLHSLFNDYQNPLSVKEVHPIIEGIGCWPESSVSLCIVGLCPRPTQGFPFHLTTSFLDASVYSAAVEPDWSFHSVKTIVLPLLTAVESLEEAARIQSSETCMYS